MWEGFCERLREYGRDGSLFVFVFLVMLPSGLFWDHGGAAFLGGFVLVFLCRVGIAFAGQRDRFEKLGRMPPLSERDLQTARTKLTAGRGTR